MAAGGSHWRASRQWHHSFGAVEEASRAETTNRSTHEPEAQARQSLSPSPITSRSFETVWRSFPAGNDNLNSLSSLYHLYKSSGRPAAARLSAWNAQADQIVAASGTLEKATDEELRQRARELRWRAKSGERLAALATDAYALVREASRRALGMQHFPVQLVGGLALFEGHIAEMQTGEGKTLTATLPAFIRALPGLGCHVITVNDYLARRDAEQMGKVYRQLGLSVGCIQSEMEPPQRRDAYAQDITYVTAKECGFDFLRDRLQTGADAGSSRRERQYKGAAAESQQVVQRGHHFALIDEADSILIDEARTPLIIGLTLPNDPATVNLMRWSHRATHHLTPEIDYVYEPDRRSAWLTDTGCRKVVLLSKPSLLNSVDTGRIYSQVERALIARLGFQRDRDYVVVDEEIVIVDESTGRMMDGRKWQDGLHQAVEAKELVPITAATGQAARITVQSFFRIYDHLAGMTGTAAHARRELGKSYQRKVSVIPTHRPCIREGLPTRVFMNLEAKSRAVVDEIESLRRKHRAVLVGTPSVEASEVLSKLLKDRGIAHEVLNAHFHEQEAEIVSRAGGAGRVTIATNMAGRGTDIILDDEVRSNGGLHVVATEMHSSARIDRQLIGRAARQGDPGSYRFFLSLEDELLRCLTSESRQKKASDANPNERGEISAEWLGYFRETQQFLEKEHRKQRRNLFRQEKARTELYEKMRLDPYLELTE